MTSAGAKALRSDPGRLPAVTADAQRLGARVIAQYATIGEFDFLTLIEAPDNASVAAMSAELSRLGTIRLEVLPAISMDKFSSLLKLQPYRTEPHRWQTQPWARRTMKDRSSHHQRCVQCRGFSGDTPTRPCPAP